MSVRTVRCAAMLCVVTVGAHVARAGENDRAAAALREAIATSYSYADLRGLDWDTLFAEHRAALAAAESPRALAEAAAALLAAARDLHIWLEVDGERIATYRREGPYNFAISGIKSAVPGLEQRARAVYSSALPDGTGYLLLGSLDRAGVPIETVREVLESFVGAPAVILDLRANGGGDEALAREIAGSFVERTSPYARSARRDASAEGGFAEATTRVVRPTRPAIRCKVAVLQGRYTVSSAEAFVLMMRQAPHCVTVGDTTFGSSGNPRPHDLGNGVTVYLPSWKAMDTSGRVLEGVGIPPDVVVQAGPEEFAAGDPVIGRALVVLAEN